MQWKAKTFTKALTLAIRSRDPRVRTVQYVNLGRGRINDQSILIAGALLRQFCALFCAPAYFPSVDVYIERGSGSGKFGAIKLNGIQNLVNKLHSR